MKYIKNLCYIISKFFLVVFTYRYSHTVLPLYSILGINRDFNYRKISEVRKMMHMYKKVSRGE